jgi:kinesin family member C1
VTDVSVHALSSPSQVRALLALAQSRRTVASTLMNDRSSRSHSVFTLRISGYNASGNGGAGERCEGSLNLVDLAGSERLKEVGHGQSAGTAKEGDKERLKETQNINRSLSALGDVIAALGEAGRGGGTTGEKHIPYRNSKVGSQWRRSGDTDRLIVVQLTYLLQHSLSGNSKTLVRSCSFLCNNDDHEICSLA